MPVDVWGTIVLFINILLLLAGWLLFQQAKSDLTARAAQMPVLSEVKALQKSVASLLEQLKLESIQTSAQLDARCAEARDLLALIDRRLEDSRLPGSRNVSATQSRDGSVTIDALPAERDNSSGVGTGPGTDSAARTADPRREQVYMLADQGASAGEIARETGFSEGEVELLLRLRPQVA